MKNRIGVVIACGLIIGMTNTPQIVRASEDVMIQNNLTQIQTYTDIAVPYADKIVTKTRIYNGVYQYRRWNVTKNCWVDSHWINF
jgi:hypothetical protein